LRIPEHRERVLDGLNALSSKSADMPHELRTAFAAYWSALTHQIRVTRNEAGHPEGVGPVSEDSVHAALLLFPDLAKVAKQLNHWIRVELR
jgi:hypothetical protein